MTTHVERLTKLYTDYDGQRDVPSSSEIRECLGPLNPAVDSINEALRVWHEREVQIDFHPYIRERDWNRALRRNDFNLARTLDQAVA